MGMPTDYWKPGNLMDEVEELLQDRFGFTPRDQPWILRQSNDQVFLNHDLLHQRGMDRNTMARFVAERCAPRPGLSKAIAACDAPALAANDPVVERLIEDIARAIPETCSSCPSQVGSTTAARAPRMDRLCARHPCARVVLGVRGASRRDVQHDVHP